MGIIEKLGNLEERIGPDWMRRIKLIIITAGVYIALGCSKEYTKPYSNSKQEQRQDIKYADTFK